MASNTKHNILTKATILFNQYGLNNVRLQQIADECQISVGNLAYHYPDHRYLVQKVFHNSLRYLMDDQESWKQCRHLIDFDNLTIQLHQRMLDHAYFFLDQLVIKRLYQKEYLLVEKYYRSLTENLNAWLKEYWNSEYRKNQFKGQDLKRCINDLLFSIRFYLNWCKLVNKDPDEIMFRKRIWGIITPYLNDMSRNEYEVLIHPKLN